MHTWGVDYGGHHRAARRQQLECFGLHCWCRCRHFCTRVLVAVRCGRGLDRLCGKRHNAGVPREKRTTAVRVLESSFGAAKACPCSEHGHPWARHPGARHEAWICSGRSRCSSRCQDSSSPFIVNRTELQNRPNRFVLNFWSGLTSSYSRAHRRSAKN